MPLMQPNLLKLKIFNDKSWDWIKFGVSKNFFFFLYNATHYGFFKVQDRGQRVPAAWPDWSEAWGGGHRCGGVGGHLLVQTQLLQRRETFSQHHHGGTHRAGLLRAEAWGGDGGTCDALTHNTVWVCVCVWRGWGQGEYSAAVLPVTRLVGSDVHGAFSRAGSSFSCSDSDWPPPSSSSQAESSCFLKHGARKSFLPVEKKMTDSLCGVWGKSGCAASPCCSPLLPISSTVSAESSWRWLAGVGRFLACSSSWSSNNLWTTSCAETKVIVNMIQPSTCLCGSLFHNRGGQAFGGATMGS